MLTDFIIAILIMIFAWQGWSTGLLQSLIGPFCVCFCIFIAFLYLDLTENLLIAFLIALAGSVVLASIASGLFHFWQKTVDQRYRESVFPGSRLAGAAVSILWLSGLLIGCLVLSALIPSEIKSVQTVQKDIHQSYICSWTEHNILSRIPLTRNLLTILSIANDSARLARLSESRELQDFLAEEKVQDCIRDPEIVRLFKNKNLPGLLSHPKVRNLLQDHEVMRRLTKVAKKIYMEGREKGAGTIGQGPTSQYKSLKISAEANPDQPDGP